MGGKRPFGVIHPGMAANDPIADIAVEAHSSAMTDEPIAYIAATLSSLGITFHSLIVSRYEPMIFGNLLASLETTAGALRIIYDRGFFVEADQWAEDAPSMDAIATELTLQREAANDS